MWVLAMITAYFIAVPMMLLIGRLRFPAMPFVSVLAGYGGAQLLAYASECRSLRSDAR